MSAEPVENVVDNVRVLGILQPVGEVVATHDETAHACDMDEPWGGDTDLRNLYMSERFGSRKQLNRERAQPTYRSKASG